MLKSEETGRKKLWIVTAIKELQIAVKDIKLVLAEATDRLQHLEENTLGNLEEQCFDDCQSYEI